MSGGHASDRAQTVFIVDDDEAVRESLSVLLQSEGLRTQSFASAEAFLETDLGAVQGCLVVDIHMPGLTGLELQQTLKQRQIVLPTVVITGQGDVPKAVAALKAGAVDFLEKPYNVDALLKVVNAALDQEGHARHREVRARLEQLSRREREVMDLMVSGHPNKAIGRKLGISTRTVENHRAKVMGKMRCDNLSALIHLMLQTGPG